MAFDVIPFATDYPGSEGHGRAFVLGESKALDTFQNNLKSTMEDIAKKRTAAAKDISDIDVDMSNVWDADTPYFSQELSKFRDDAAKFYQWSYNNPNQYGTEEYFKKYNDIKKKSDQLRLEADMSAMQKEVWSKANTEYSTKQDQYDEQSLADQAKYRGMNIYQRQAALAGAQDPSTGKIEPVKLLTPSVSVDYNKMIKGSAENIGDYTKQTDTGTTKIIQVNPYFDKDGTMTDNGKKAFEQAKLLLSKDQEYAKWVKMQQRNATKAGMQAPSEEDIIQQTAMDVIKSKDNQWKQDVLAPKEAKEDKGAKRLGGNRLQVGNTVVSYSASYQPVYKGGKKGLVESYQFDNVDSNGNVIEKNDRDWVIEQYDAANKKVNKGTVFGRLREIGTDPTTGALIGKVLTNDVEAIKYSNPEKYNEERNKMKKDLDYSPIIEVQIPLQGTDNYNNFMNQYGISPWEVRYLMTGSYSGPKEDFVGTNVTTPPPQKRASGEQAPKSVESIKAEQQKQQQGQQQQQKQQQQPKAAPATYDQLDEPRKKQIDMIMKNNPGVFKTKDDAYRFLLKKAEEAKKKKITNNTEKPSSETPKAIETQEIKTQPSLAAKTAVGTTRVKQPQVLTQDQQLIETNNATKTQPETQPPTQPAVNSPQKNASKSMDDYLADEAAKTTMEYEYTKGDIQGKGLSNYGNPRISGPNKKEEAVKWYMANVASKIPAYARSVKEKAAIGDFIYNTGKDITNYLIQEYYKKNNFVSDDQISERGKIDFVHKSMSEDEKREALRDMSKLTESQMLELIRLAKDWYYKNSYRGSPGDGEGVWNWGFENGDPNKPKVGPDGSLSPGYGKTWKERVNMF